MDRWETQTVPVEVKGKGVYLVEAVTKQYRAYTIVMVSDLAMITKQAPGRMVAMVVQRGSGHPVPDAEVTLWSNTNAHVSTKSWKANTQGLVDAPVAANNNSDLRLMAREPTAMADAGRAPEPVSATPRSISLSPCSSISSISMWTILPEIWFWRWRKFWTT